MTHESLPWPTGKVTTNIKTLVFLCIYIWTTKRLCWVDCEGISRQRCDELCLCAKRDHLPARRKKTFFLAKIYKRTTFRNPIFTLPRSGLVCASNMTFYFILICFLAKYSTLIKYITVIRCGVVTVVQMENIWTITDKSNIKSHAGAELQSNNQNLKRRRKALPFSSRLPPRSAIMKSWTKTDGSRAKWG